MSSLTVSFGYDKGIADTIKAMGDKSEYAIRKAVDEVGNKTRTQVIRAVAKQAGVKTGRVRGVLHTSQAMGAGAGTFTITARDVTLSLKEFSPRQTSGGVIAKPWNERKLFAKTFFGPGGHVYKNTHKYNNKSKRNNAIEKLWGPAIPKEMVKDEAERTFFANVETLLPAAVEKWLMRQK